MFVHPGFEDLKLITVEKVGGWERVPVPFDVMGTNELAGERRGLALF